MGDSASASPIAAPKGGGALQGIGEKFSPDLHTGTANFSIPLTLPPGRNGFAPQLGLAYSSGSPNGPFGLGMSLTVPGVTRRTAKGIPRYRDAASDSQLHDVFILSGAEDLVPVESAENVRRYRPRTEGLFARIERRLDVDYWVVRTKDGLVSRYGVPLPNETDRAVIANPEDTRRIFAWKLTETVDPFGNRIEYSYERDRMMGARAWDQLYLSQIRYIDYVDQNVTKYLVTVDFEYDERPDPFSDHRAGFEIRTRRRCKRITVRTHADTDRLVRTYAFTYADERPELEDRRPHNGVSLLSRIVVTGHDGDRSEQMAPLDVDYTRFQPERRRLTRIDGRELPTTSFASGSLDLVDLFGHGLPDILEMNGSVRYWRNIGGGRFAMPREMSTAPAGLQLTSPGVQLVDADGDGRTDLLVTDGAMAGYYPLSFAGGWDARAFQTYAAAPSFDLRDPEVHLLDLNGDGITDALRAGARLECFFSDPERGWRETREVERRALDRFPNVNFSDSRVKWGDMTGDGLQDLVMIYDGGVDYWPSRGWGDWGARVSMRNSPRLPYGYDPRRVLLGDIDGDGAADLLYVGDGTVTLWLNQSGNGWSDPIVIRGTPGISDADAVRLTDLLGNGVPGLLWSADATVGGTPRLFFLDFTGGVKPYLLFEMRNNMGARTTVSYASSTQFYLADQADPQRRWGTPLPFPVHVVAKSESIDELSGGRLTTEYTYHHGYWDGIEREFRGFGRVDQRDAEVISGSDGITPSRVMAAPIETRTWFHQGPIGSNGDDVAEMDYSFEYWVGDSGMLARPADTASLLRGLPHPARRDALRAFRGLMLRTELYALDGSNRQQRPYTVKESGYALREEQPPRNNGRLRIFYPHQVAERTTQWERGSDPMTRFHYYGGHDVYGRSTLELDIAVPRGRNPLTSGAAGDPHLATLTQRTYATRDDASIFIADRIARQSVYEIVNDGSVSVAGLYDTALNDAASRRVIGETCTFYDGSAFEGLPVGQIGTFGASVRVERLILTDEILQQAYGTGSSSVSAPEIPPYLTHVNPVAWSDEYPAAFRDALPPLAGYVYRAATPQNTAGWFAITERRRFDFHGSDPARGLPVTTRNSLGRDTAITFDRYWVAPTEVTDPAQLTTTAQYDYRVLQPSVLTDANGNRTIYTYSPLGLLQTRGVMGRLGELVGDTTDSPSVRFDYDFLAFARNRQPVSVRTTRRVYHATDADAPPSARNDVLVALDYSDGFGRSLQQRVLAEDVTFGSEPFGDSALSSDPAAPIVPSAGRIETGEPRIVVSGWNTYDNKGRTIERFEPFYSNGWRYQPRTDPAAAFGQKAVLRYDARGQLTATLLPDGSEQRLIYGIPTDLTNPDSFMPSPWETCAYDGNDNAGRTHPSESTAYHDHWNTPGTAVVNAHGRVVANVERRGPVAASDWYVTRTEYDVAGNIRTVTDPLGRIAFRYVYDLLGRAWRTEQLDTGVRRIVIDAGGGVIETRDQKGALLLYIADAAGRPVALWARDTAASDMTQRQRLVYGDTLQPAAPVQSNLLGRLYQHHDDAGLVTFAAYDVAGNVVEKARRVLRSSTVMGTPPTSANNWTLTPYAVQWAPPSGMTAEAWAESLLETVTYETTTRFDALNRVASVRYPETTTGGRPVLSPSYNRAGALDRVELDGHAFVERIAYDAKGRRILVAYGNGVMTRYAFHARTLRLARIRSERFTHPGGAPLTYAASAPAVPLQDLTFAYDLVGNVIAIHDRSPASGVRGNPDALSVNDPALAALLASGDALIRRFEYDALYRIRSATGRQCPYPAATDFWADELRCGSGFTSAGATSPGSTPDVTTLYRETYEYDAAGNLAEMVNASTAGTHARRFGFGGLTAAGWADAWPQHVSAVMWPNAPTNRLTHVGDVATSVPSYSYDANGNLTREATSRHFHWDYADRLVLFRTQTAGAAPSIYTRYLYDAAGQRVAKLTARQSGALHSTVYVDSIFEHHHEEQSENCLVHVMDGRQRVAAVRIGAAFTGDTSPAMQYHLGDHLESSALVVDDTAGTISREEYTPYGDTAVGSFGRKRFRFCGKERDEESGLYYVGARYYAPWLARWTSCDPSGRVDGTNLYAYTRGNPLRRTDPTGTQSLEQRIEKIESPVGWFFARTGYDIWNAMSMGTLSKVESQQNLGTWEGLGQSTFTGGRSFSNAASLGLQDRIYDAQMKEGPKGIVTGTLQAGEDLLPIAEAKVLADPATSAADKWRAGGTALAKTANLVALGAGATGKNPVLTGETGELLVAYKPPASGSGPGHNMAGVTTEVGTRWFDIVLDNGPRVTSGELTLSGPGEIRSLPPGPEYMTARVKVPLANAESALAFAEGKLGPSQYNLAINNCTTFTTSVLGAGGLPMPAISPSITFALFKGAPFLPQVMLGTAATRAAVNTVNDTNTKR